MSKRRDPPSGAQERDSKRAKIEVPQSAFQDAEEFNIAVLKQQNQQLFCKLKQQQTEIKELKVERNASKQASEKAAVCANGVELAFQELIEILKSVPKLATVEQVVDIDSSLLTKDFLGVVKDSGASSALSLEFTHRNGQIREALTQLSSLLAQTVQKQINYHKALSTLSGDDQKLAQLTERHAELTRDLKDTKQALAIAENNARVQQRKMDALQLQVTDYEAAKKETVEETFKLRERLERFERDSHRLEQKVSTMTVKLESAQLSSSFDTDHDMGQTEQPLLDKDVQATIEELRRKLASRLQEIKQLQDEKVGLLKAANAHNLGQGTHSGHSTTEYKALEAKYLHIKADLDKSTQTAASLQETLLDANASHAKQLKDLEATRINHVNNLQNKINELHSKMATAMLNENKNKHGSEQLKGVKSSQELMKELKQMAESSELRLKKTQEENAKLKKQVEESKALLDKKSEEALNKTLEEKELAVKMANEEIKKLKSVIDQHSKQQQKWTDKEHELKLMIKGYQKLPSEQLDAAKLQVAANIATSKQEKAEAELEKFKSGEALERVKKEVADKMKRLESQNKDLSKHIFKVKEEKTKILEDLSSQKEEVKALYSEIETISLEYEKNLEQNARLLTHMQDKDESNTTMYKETLKMTQIQNNLRKENDLLKKEAEAASNALTQVKTQMDLLREKVAIVEKKNQQLMTERTLTKDQKKALEESAQHSDALSNEVKTKLVLVQNSFDDFKKNSGQGTIEAEKEKHINKRLEEELLATKRKLQRYQRDPQHRSSKLEETVEILTKTLRCPICCQKDINAVIGNGRCHHLFCKDCLYEQLAVRNRKCAVCDQLFGRDDIQSVYFA